MRICLLASVPHTGTNWLLEFLKPRFDHVVQAAALAKTSSYRRQEVGCERYVNCGFIKGSNLVWGHFRQKEKALMFGLATAWPAVVTVRDPLLALCSCRNRELAEQGFANVFESWQLFAAFDDWRPQYVPVDRLAGPAEIAFRHSMMVLGVQLPVAESVAQLASPPVNSRGIYPLRRLYNDGDKKALRKALGVEIFDRLRNMEGLLRPILERIGYRELMWWTK